MNKDKRGADLNALLKDVRFPTPMPTPEPGASAIRQAWLAIQGFHASHALPEFCCSYTAFEEFVGRLLKGSVNHPEAVEPFVVKHYVDSKYPEIKGNGFDGLQVGEDREEAEEFVRWLNAHLPQNEPQG